MNAKRPRLAVFFCLCLCAAFSARAALSAVPGHPPLLPPSSAAGARDASPSPFAGPLRRSAPFMGLKGDLPPPSGFSGQNSPDFTPSPVPAPASPRAPRTAVPAAPRAPFPEQKPPSSAARAEGGEPSPDERTKPDLSIMLGQMIMVGFSGFELSAGHPLAEEIRTGRVGNVILFERDARGVAKNIASPAQLRLLTASLQKFAPRPLFIAVDQEGGLVQRLRPERGFEGGPAAAALGRGSPEKTRLTARRMGLEMAALGINLDLAPVADVNTNPLNPIVGALQRSFGADPRSVSAHVRAFGEGLAQAGVAPCMKHFPGHGSSGVDSHDLPPDISASWRPEELVPYAENLKQGWPGAVMPGHLFHRGLDALYPASLSGRILGGLLRGRLGFDGVIISDDLQMGAVTVSHSAEERILLAVEAGVDILLFGNNSGAPEVTASEVHGILLSLAWEGRISRKRVELSFERVKKLKRRFAGWKP
jgi:beta-N-acetylhexosaminidase